MSGNLIFSFYMRAYLVIFWVNTFCFHTSHTQLYDGLGPCLFKYPRLAVSGHTRVHTHTTHTLSHTLTHVTHTHHTLRLLQTEVEVTSNAPAVVRPAPRRISRSRVSGVERWPIRTGTVAVKFGMDTYKAQVTCILEATDEDVKVKLRHVLWG